MKKILFGITSLTVGGAERVLVDLANKISSDYDVTIYTIYDEGSLKKQLNDRVKTISLYNKRFEDYNKIQRLEISAKLMLTNKPPEGFDVYIAFLEGPITRLFSKNTNISSNNKTTLKEKTKKIAWVHNDISKVFGKGLISKVKKHFDKKVYKQYDTIVFVSNENKEDFNETYGDNFNEKVIRNYLDYNSVISKSNQNIKTSFNKNDINLVTVCRLVEQKAIERFIKIHAKLEQSGIHSKVYVIGDGPLRYSLQRQIDKLGETENFYLLGAKDNPYPYIKNADYFCLLSYYEGYGMVIDEAKILNKRIIITDTAARESIEKYENSVIVENTEKGIYEGLKKVLISDTIDKSLEKNEYANNKQVIKYYEEIIKKIEDIIK